MFHSSKNDEGRRGSLNNKNNITLEPPPPPPLESSEHSPLLLSMKNDHNNEQHGQQQPKQQQFEQQPSNTTQKFLFYFTSLLLLTCFIIFDVLSTLYFKKSLNVLYQYPFLASELNYVLTCGLFFIGHLIYSEIYYPFKVQLNSRENSHHHSDHFISMIVNDSSNSIHPMKNTITTNTTPTTNTTIIETTTTTTLNTTMITTTPMNTTPSPPSPPMNHNTRHHSTLYSIHYLNISICNIFETLFQIIGSNGMGKNSGTLMVLLAQMNIPLSVLCTLFIFKVKYNALQWCGVVCILLGIFIVVILPYLVVLARDEVQQEQQQHSSTRPSLIYAGIFVLSCFFTVGQRMYEMYLLKRTNKRNNYFMNNTHEQNKRNTISQNVNDTHEKRKRNTISRNTCKDPSINVPLNVYTLGFYERIYELILNTILMFPLYYFFINQYDSFNSFIHDMNIAFNNVLFGERQGWITIVIFNINSYIWLQLRLLCVKYINADITFFANAFAFPFCTLVFALPFMKFIIPEQSPITPYHIVSIVVLFIGLVLYGIGERRSNKDGLRGKTSL
nr:unnamed protein product [Naegleria fowleri]